MARTLDYLGELDGAPTRERVEMVLGQLESCKDPNEYISLANDEGEDWLTVYFVSGYGFYVTGLVGGRFRTAVTPGMEDEPVEAAFAGEVGRYERRAFVARRAACAAILAYLDDTIGHQLADWVDADFVTL